jgi:hypothetical protein
LLQVWADHVAAKAAFSSGLRGDPIASVEKFEAALRAHRELIFGKRAGDFGISEMTRQKALQILEKEDAILPKTTVLRCRVRYFTDGAIFGSQEFVSGYIGIWQLGKQRKFPPKANAMRGADWQGLATIQGLRKEIFG